MAKDLGAIEKQIQALKAAKKEAKEKEILKLGRTVLAGWKKSGKGDSIVVSDAMKTSLELLDRT